MVKYGPIELFQCNHCDEFLVHRSILEINGRHSVAWSDGYFDSPTAPEPPLLVKCPSCKGVVWLPEIEFYPSDGRESKEFVFLTESEYWYQLLQHKPNLSEHLLYLRIKCWQISNHPYRQSPEIMRSLSDLETENLEGILALIDIDSSSECNIAIEVLRHLGRFDEAMQLIEDLSAKLDPEIVSFQRDLIAGGKTNVFVCTFHGGKGS